MNLMQPSPNMYQNPYVNVNMGMTRPVTAVAQNAIQWVQGIEGAKAYQLAPSSNTMLLDSENDGIFYIKTSDNVGMCNLRIFKFEEVTQQQSAKINPDEYVKKSELEELVNRMLGGTNDQSVQSAEPVKSKITK